MQLSYQGGFSLVKPYGGEEGSGYGHGDGRMFPNAGGLVTTQDGAKVTFLMQGRTVFGQNAKGERVGGQNIVMWFEADDERYKWLNDAMCVVEGVIAGLSAIRFRVFECVNELIAES